MHKLFPALLILLASTAHAERLSRELGREIGQIGKGAAETILTLQPEWETVQPRGREECLRESGGVLDNRYMRCRNGRQEWVRYDADGRRKVLQERAIPH